MDLVDKYLTEGYKKFGIYKEGDVINVEAERIAIYASPGYVPSGRITKMTLVVKDVINNKGDYVVLAKGKYSKYAGGAKVPKTFRLEIHKDMTMGNLTTSSPKPLKYYVNPL